MSELTFYCPRCDQKIVCDDAWSGQQLQCPSCQVTLVVPHAQSAGAPSPPAPTPAPIQIAARATPPPPAAPPLIPPPGPTPFSSMQRSPQRPAAAKSKGGGAGKAVKIAVFAVVFIVCGYFGFIFAQKWQSKLNEKSQRAAQDS